MNFVLSDYHTVRCNGPGSGGKMNGMLARAGVILFAAGIFFIPGCGGGGGGAESTPPTTSYTALVWDPPRSYDDQSPLDPYRDLDHYEFHVRSDLNFTSDDQPVAEVAAVTDVLSPDGTVVSQDLTTRFELSNLLPYLPQGTRSYLSIRVVGIDGRKSGFAEAVAWDRPS